MASVTGIEATLLSVHGMLAAFTKSPEIALTGDEAKMLAGAIAEVSKHYPLPGLTPGHAALGGLAVTMFHVYRPKVAALARRRAEQRAHPNGPDAPTVPNAAPNFAGVPELARETPPPPTWFVPPTDRPN